MVTRRPHAPWLRALLATACLACLGACSLFGTADTTAIDELACTSNADCAPGAVCSAGFCAPGADVTAGDTSTDLGHDADDDTAITTDDVSTDDAAADTTADLDVTTSDTGTTAADMSDATETSSPTDTSETSDTSDVDTTTTDDATDTMDVPDMVFAGPGLDVGERVLIDFGDPATITPDVGWNNLAGPSDGPLDAPITTDERVTDLTVTIVETFTGMNSNGPVSTSTAYPASATLDTLWVGSFDGHAASLLERAVVSVGNLPTDQTYTISIFAGRSGLDMFMGMTLDRLGQYTLQDAAGDSVAELDATNNIENTVEFAGVVAKANGTVDLTLEVSPNGTGRFAYIGVIEITRTQ